MTGGSASIGETPLLKATLPGSICIFSLGVTPDEESVRPAAASLSAIQAATAPFRTGFYPNFVEEPADASAFFDAATWQRLRETKALYDPGELFKANHPIPPA